MRILLILSLFAMVNSCKTNNPSTTNAEQNTPKEVENENTEMIKTETSATIQNNSSFEIKYDEFDNSYLAESAGKQKVFKFVVSEKAPEGTADGNYTETILFEFTDSMLPISKASKNLQDVKLAFGKLCFCRDTGYYKIEEGTLSVTKKGNKYTIDLAFTIDGVSHRMSTVNETIVVK